MNFSLVSFEIFVDSSLWCNIPLWKSCSSGIGASVNHRFRKFIFSRSSLNRLGQNWTNGVLGYHWSRAFLNLSHSWSFSSIALSSSSLDRTSMIACLKVEPPMNMRWTMGTHNQSPDPHLIQQRNQHIPPTNQGIPTQQSASQGSKPTLFYPLINPPPWIETLTCLSISHTPKIAETIHEKRETIDCA
jgi:hypothetical protein